MKIASLIGPSFFRFPCWRNLKGNISLSRLRFFGPPSLTKVLSRSFLSSIIYSHISRQKFNSLSFSVLFLGENAGQNAGENTFFDNARKRRYRGFDVAYLSQKVVKSRSIDIASSVLLFRNAVSRVLGKNFP